MGLSFTKFWSRLFNSKKEKRVVMVGLDGAGKTTVLYQLKLGEVQTTIPTIGFNVETVAYKNVNFTVWDIGGQDKIRPLWRYYYTNADAVIFVVDSTDDKRIDDASGYQHSARDELQTLLAEDELKDAAVLVLANKQDTTGALKVKDVAQRLGLAGIKKHQWHVQGCCAVSGDGLYEGLDWLTDVLQKRN